MSAQRLLTPRTAGSLVLLALASCGEASASPSPAGTDGFRPLRAEEIELPTPEVELPELPFDKAQLDAVRSLDEMIVDSAALAAAVEQFQGMFHALEDASEVSMSGTSEDQIRATMIIVDGFREFDRMAIPFGRKAAATFRTKHGDDEAFASAFRETYARAEEELWDAIEDDVLRRSTGAAMSNGYRYAGGSNLSYLESMLAESEELREQGVDRVISSVETDLMVADYKKGGALTDLLRASRSQLEVVRPLDENGERVDAILARVEEKEAARREEIAAAREAYRFPERYDGPNAPKYFYKREEELRGFLRKSDYDPLQVTVAGPWIRIFSVLGVPMYDQLDFYVAVRNEEESGVIDVLYVTGKTSAAEPNAAITRVSVGVVAQMLESNL